jgi:hypothetical protein
LFILVHKFPIKHMCWHSITKIHRNGPRAHFPFTTVDGGGQCRKQVGSGGVHRAWRAWAMEPPVVEGMGGQQRGATGDRGWRGDA